jgi:hypothetical protein
MRFKRCAASLLDSPDWQSWSLSGIESPYANPTLTSCGARQRLSAAPTDIVITTRDSVKEIADQAAFFASRPTMGAHLAKLVAPTLPMIGASWCRTRRRLASGLACCTAAKMSAREPCHTARCGRTACHQPEQTLPRRLTTSIIEIDDAVGTPAVRVAWRREELSR